MTEHTPTPWIFDSEAIMPISRDGISIVARIPNHPDNKVNWEADAAFIVRSANNHDAMVAELQRLFEMYGHQATADVLRAVKGAPDHG
jgi:hypothetical protein